ncbi:hypothetical protein SCHPADRAFT_941604 [Schizopora paradoxa]|uniref:Integrase core domain-containing protein n=1 Tax=Schizopora paradoxa TaxID=27342 RepID=A0A0H2RJ03_9AGAM|nr:hypothetical protein SCHPADRAFT_941604 [Schizopora paradoxa]
MARRSSARTARETTQRTYRVRRDNSVPASPAKGKNACNGKQKNQFPPTPKVEDIKHMLQLCVTLGMSDDDTATYILGRIPPGFSLSGKTVQRMRTEEKILKTRKQKHTAETILPALMEVKDEFPRMGARTMTQTLRVEHGICVSEPTVLGILHIIEPAEVQARKHRQFKKRTFYTRGVNEFWCLDQHDKMQRFGLRFHVCLEPTSGKILWLKVWWTNSNPRIVLKYFLDVVKELGYVPSFTMSDKGTENNLVANIQTLVRQALDGSLDDTILHRWMLKHGNIKPEIFWAGFRRSWAPGYNDLFEIGGFNKQGLCDPSDVIDQLCFRYLAIPWVQKQLDRYVHCFNHTPRRADKAKILPEGIPDLIFNEPLRYSGRDLKVVIPELSILDQFEKTWLPAGHPVLDLVPPEFKAPADRVFIDQLRRPIIKKKNFWTIFRKMRSKMDREMNSLPPTFPVEMGSVLEDDARLHKEVVNLLEGYQKLR